MTGKSVKEEIETKVLPKTKRLVVMRFGGSSISTVEGIKAVVKMIKGEIAKGYQIVALVSAIPIERENAINFAKALHSNPPAKLLNDLVSSCDFKSAQLLTIALEHIGIPTNLISGKSIMIKPRRKKAKVLYKFADDPERDKIINEIKKLIFQEVQEVVVLSGFKVIEEKEKIDKIILRDSNASAVALSSLVEANCCLIYTSTDGIYSVDPRIVPTARRINFLTYSQMRHFASMGARILSTRCVNLANSLGVTVKVKISPALGKSTGGTIIGPAKLSQSELVEAGMAIQPKVVRLKISGLTEKLIAALKNIYLVDFAINLEAGYIIVTEEDIDEVYKKIERFQSQGVEIQEKKELASITLIDWRMVDAFGYIDRILQSLVAVLNINRISINTAGNSILILIERPNMEKAANAIAKAFKLVK